MSQKEARRVLWDCSFPKGVINQSKAGQNWCPIPRPYLSSPVKGRSSVFCWSFKENKALGEPLTKQEEDSEDRIEQTASKAHFQIAGVK